MDPRYSDAVDQALREYAVRSAAFGTGRPTLRERENVPGDITQHIRIPGEPIPPGKLWIVDRSNPPRASR